MTSTNPPKVSSDAERYVPAAGHAFLARAYDPVMAATMREQRFRSQMLDRLAASLPTGGTLLDVGSGTGSFAIAAAGRFPDATVIGVDGDRDVLKRAESKPGGQGVEWRNGRADEIPVDSASVDVVVMSLLLHHLSPAGKRDALSEAHRALRSGGTLLIADWGRPHDWLMRCAFGLVQILDGFANTQDHVAGRLPAMVVSAGFEQLNTFLRLRTPWGSLELIEAFNSTETR